MYNNQMMDNRRSLNPENSGPNPFTSEDRRLAHNSFNRNDGMVHRKRVHNVKSSTIMLNDSNQPKITEFIPPGPSASNSNSLENKSYEANNNEKPHTGKDDRMGDGQNEGVNNQSDG